MAPKKVKKVFEKLKCFLKHEQNMQFHFVIMFCVVYCHKNGDPFFPTLYKKILLKLKHLN